MILLPLILYLYALKDTGLDYTFLFRWWNIILIIWFGLLLIYSTVKIIREKEYIVLEKYIQFYSKHRKQYPVFFETLTDLILNSLSD